MKITVISFDFWGYDAHIVEALRQLGVTANHINIGKYRHRNIGAKITNAFSKLFFGKNLKNELRQQQMMEDLKKLGVQDKILVINPELIAEKYHKEIQKSTRQYLTYLYDSLARCPAEHLLGYFNEVFSFDKADCKNHGFTFITNYNYLPESAVKTNSEYDVVSLSSYDMRLKKAEKIASKLQGMGLKFHFKIIGKKAWFKRLTGKNPGFTYSGRRISHEQIPIFYNSGNAILDLVREKQSGLSFRIFEAMALKKKIITDNQSIKDHDFYNPQNIFILDESLEIDRGFFSTGYAELPVDIYRKYTVENWVKRVFAL